MGKSRKARPPSTEKAHETPNVSTSTRAMNGRNAPERDVPMATSPKARPRQAANQRFISMVATTPPQICPHTHTMENSAANSRMSSTWPSPI